MMKRYIANAASRAQEIGPKISQVSVLLTKKPEEPKAVPTVIQPPVQIGVHQQQVALIQQQTAVADAQRKKAEEELNQAQAAKQKLEQELEDSRRIRETLEQTNAQLTSQLDAYEAAHRQISTPSSNGSPAKQSPSSANRKASMPPSSPAGSERFRLPNSVANADMQESPKRGSPNIVETKQEAELDKLSVSSKGSNSIIPDFKELTSPEFGKMIQKLKSQFPAAADDEASVMSSPVLVSTPKGSSGSDDAFTVVSPQEPKKEGKRNTKS
jgi:hypothetical protein